MMAKKIKRMLAMAMVLCMFVGMIPLQALAADGTVESEGTSKEGLPTQVTTTTTTTPGENGETKVVVTIEKTDGTTQSGVTVNREETTTVTTQTDANGNVVSEVGVNEGKETIVLPSDKTKPVDNVEVAIPDKAGESNTVKYGESTTVSGDLKQGEDDPEYDQTTTTIYGEVTVKNEGSNVTDHIPEAETKLDYVMSETAPDGTNDLIHENGSLAPADRLPGSNVEDPADVQGVKGFDYVYVGTGNTSQLQPAVVYKDELTGEEVFYIPTSSPYLTKTYKNEAGKTVYGNDAHNPEDKTLIGKDENGNDMTVMEDGILYYLDQNGEKIIRSEKTVVGPDGKTYYLHRMDVLNGKHYAEGWYQESHIDENGNPVAGEWIVDLNAVDEKGKKIQFGVVYATSQQFVLVDMNTGESIITYCADMETKTEKGYGYTMENLKDADYYTAEEADRIRAIANAGYWGAESGAGSLEAMKQMLKEAGFSDEDLASLTDGVAQTATQMAIWSCSNKMDDIQFVNAHYIGATGDTSTDKTGYGAFAGSVPEDKEAEVRLMFRVYEYLKSLKGETVQGTTADTIINSDNFIENMAVTVVKKAEDHAANKDTDKNNDAYVANLTFALVVETAKDEDGNPTNDDLIVKVVNSKGEPVLDSNGHPVVGRIAGELKDGETMLVEENGNYCFKDIILTEGDQTISLNLQGIQNLENGVYLYSSEIRTDEDGEKTSSQTLVGLAGGQRAVNVSMDITFSLDVNEGVVARERVWRDEYDPRNPPEDPHDPPENPQDPPQTWNRPRNQRLANDGVEIPEEPVPLAAPVITGDNTFLWVAFALMVAFCMVAVNLFGRKRNNEAF